LEKEEDGSTIQRSKIIVRKDNVRMWRQSNTDGEIYQDVV
jgi:hypothetical protein